MGKWIAFVVAVAAALIAFLVFRRKAAAAMSGAANTTGTPPGATAGGVVAALRAPARREATPSYTPGGTREIASPPAPLLPVVGTGLSVPTKPSTQALPSAFNPATTFGGFPSIGVGQSFYVTPKSAPAPAPPPPVSSTTPKFTLASRF